MTYERFFEHVQNYYGPYPENSRVPDYVLAYLKRDIDERKLKTLFRYITYSCPVNFGAPGIASIEKAINEAEKNRKGYHVYKSSARTKIEKEEISDEEYFEGLKLIEKVGGFNGLINIRGLKDEEAV